MFNFDSAAAREAASKFFRRVSGNVKTETAGDEDREKPRVRLTPLAVSTEYCPDTEGRVVGNYKCRKCGGSGLYKSGPADCYRCAGKGYHNQADRLRNYGHKLHYVPYP